MNTVIRTLETLASNANLANLSTQERAQLLLTLDLTEQQKHAVINNDISELERSCQLNAIICLILEEPDDVPDEDAPTKKESVNFACNQVI